MLIVLTLLAAFGIAFLFIRSAWRQTAGLDDEDDEDAEGKPPPAPARFEPRPPDERVDFDELRPDDAVDVETASGSRYRFILRDAAEATFSVDVRQADGGRQSFKALVTGSVRGSVVFERTFAAGCLIHMFVLKGDGMAPKRTTAVTAVRQVRARDGLN